MPRRQLELNDRKRPLEATAEYLKALHDGGLSLRRLAAAYGITHQRVAQLIAKAKQPTASSKREVQP